MEQDILMWMSVVAAFGYTFYSFGKVIWQSFQDNKVGCCSSCSSCSAKTDLLKHINDKAIAKNNN